jgi:ribosomal protein L11 methyltransferase
MEKYFSLTVKGSEERIIGILSQFPFESFEEKDDEILAYISELEMTDFLKKDVEATLLEFSLQFSWDSIEPQNWNQLWESSFHPVNVEGFCQVRALFHPPDSSVKFDIIVQPKMAFGTGHHATTHMMLQWMSTCELNDLEVFDFGCGTGILAVLAGAMGAQKVDAVDIERESYLNTIENAEVNQISCIHAWCGEIDDVPFQPYHIVLANINRNVLLKHASEIRNRMLPGGILIWSGVLEDDAPQVAAAFASQGFVQEGILLRNGWAAVKMKLQ